MIRTIVLILLALFTILVLYLRISSLLFPVNVIVADQLPKVDFCKSEEAIIYFQKKQWEKAKVEVYGSSQVGFQGSDFSFYKRPFGAVELLLNDLPGNYSRMNPKNLSSLVYYRIFKNGNDNLRSVCLQLAYELDGGQADYDRQGCFHRDECLHRRLHYLLPSKVENRFLSSKTRSQRKAFVFVRDPLARFISAVTEIDYRLVKRQRQKQREQPSSPFTQPMGSQARAVEFLDLLLLSSGSRALFRDHLNLELQHFVPQIPSLLLAHRIEEEGSRGQSIAEMAKQRQAGKRTGPAPIGSGNGPLGGYLPVPSPAPSIAPSSNSSSLRIYRLEQFEKEVKRLGQWTGLRDLFRIAELQARKRAALLLAARGSRGEKEEDKEEEGEEGEDQGSWTIHRSSRDPYGTARALRSFLSYASYSAYAELFPLSSSNTSSSSIDRLPLPPLTSPKAHRSKTRAYLRAFCRLYLVDYLCLPAYRLPVDCADLQQEALTELLGDANEGRYQRRRERHHRRYHLLDSQGLGGLLRSLLPPRLIESFVAPILCSYLPRSWLPKSLGQLTEPQCEAGLLHGPAVLFNEDDDEEGLSGEADSDEL